MEHQTTPENNNKAQSPCAYCHQPFTPRRRDQKCCSKDCRTGYERQKSQLAKQRRPMNFKCGWCEDKFETTRTDRYFCSTPCQQAFNNHWKGFGPRLGKALMNWRVRRMKGAMTQVTRLFSEARQAAKDKRKKKD